MADTRSTLTVTLVQSALNWEDKEANLQQFEEKIMSIPERTELVILPETFNTGFSTHPERLAEKMDGPTVRWMKNISRKKNIILTGSLMIEDNGLYYNRLLWILPNGEFGFYDKRHRFGFGGEDSQFAAGSRRLIASVKGWRINLQICYDLRFPVWSRQSSPPIPSLREIERAEGGVAEYDVLIYVANWPERRNHAWKTLLQARAIENQSYVIGVNRVGTDGNSIMHSGDSMIVDPMGEILYTATYSEDVYTHTLDKSHLLSIREKLPFLRDADNFQIEI